MKLFPSYIGPLYFSVGRAMPNDKFQIRFRSFIKKYGNAPMISIGAYKVFAIIWIAPEHDGRADYYRALFKSMILMGFYLLSWKFILFD